MAYHSYKHGHPYHQCTGIDQKKLDTGAISENDHNVMLIQPLDVNESSLNAKAGTAVKGIELIADSFEHFEATGGGPSNCSSYQVCPKVDYGSAQIEHVLSLLFPSLKVLTTTRSMV